MFSKVAGNYHFIVAEDNPRDRFLIEHHLSTACPWAHISVFNNAEGALAHYRKHGADLVVTDHSMPGMSGADLVDTLRKLDPRLPIVMISSSPYGREEGLAAGVDEFLEKGHVAECLPKILLGLLGRKIDQ